MGQLVTNPNLNLHSLARYDMLSKLFVDRLDMLAGFYPPCRVISYESKPESSLFSQVFFLFFLSANTKILDTFCRSGAMSKDGFSIT